MGNLREPMLLLIKERAKQAKKGFVPARSLYRDILNLALVEFGDRLDLGKIIIYIYTHADKCLEHPRKLGVFSKR